MSSTVLQLFPNHFSVLGTVAVCTAPQGSLIWKQIRTYLLTASKFRRARGLDPWSKLDQLIYDLRNHLDSSIPNAAMQHGSATESVAKDWYSQKFHQQVLEVSLGVPLWDLRIGGSPDGLIWDDSCKYGPAGMIEIKCPDPEKGMYPQLLGKMEDPNVILHSNNWDHIKWEHYDQMQGCMAIWGRTWCDYVVYSTGDNLRHVERIPFDKEYWWQVLYPDLCRLLDIVHV